MESPGIRLTATREATIRSLWGSHFPGNIASIIGSGVTADRVIAWADDLGLGPQDAAAVHAATEARRAQGRRPASQIAPPKPRGWTAQQIADAIALPEANPERRLMLGMLGYGGQPCAACVGRGAGVTADAIAKARAAA